jgi:hypothetical protein
MLTDDLKEHMPKTPDDIDNPHPLFLAACRELSRVEGLIDILIYGDPGTKIKFYKTYREEVKNVVEILKKRYLNNPI